MANSPKLNLTDFASLLARGSRIHFERASLQVIDGCFVMEGPSGKHCLAVEVTDLVRLNGHWVTFAKHPENAYPRIKLTAKSWGLPDWGV